jgi:hypothetical protein
VVQQQRLAILLFATLAGLACGSKNTSGTKPPGVIDQVANDVETEVDGAEQTADTVGEDVSDGAEEVVDKVEG